MQIGLSSYTYPWAVGVPGYPPDSPLTVHDLLQRAVALGATAMQLGDNLPAHLLPLADWEQLQATAAAGGIQLELGARRLTPDHLTTYLRLAAEARSPFLRFVIDDGDYQPDLRQVIGIVRDVLPQLREQRLVLALENHDRFTARQLATIVDDTDPIWVGICLDTTNSFGAAEDVQTLVSALGPYVVNLHAKAFVVRRVVHKMGFVIEGTRPGDGPLALPALLDQLRPYGRCQTVTLEQWPPLLGTLADTLAQEAEWAEAGVAWIRAGLLNGYVG